MTMGVHDPTLSALSIKDQVDFVDITTGKIPIRVTATTVKFIDNIISVANEVCGMNVGPTFSVNVTGEADRKYGITVSAKTVAGALRVYVYDISHFSAVTPQVTTLASPHYEPGGVPDPITCTLTLTAATNIIAVNFTYAPNCTYKINMNFLGNINLAY